MAKWRIHVKQWERTQLTPINEFWLIVPGDTADEARSTLLKDIEYWASINQIAKADHNVKNEPFPPQVYIFYKGVHTQVYEIVRVRDNAKN